MLYPPLFAGAVVGGEFTSLVQTVADRIAGLVRSKPNAVLGLATGSTPKAIYAELVRFHQEEGLDFSGVTCFNLDEYYPIKASSIHSYHRYMAAHLFSKIKARDWRVPQGDASSLEGVNEACARFEQDIRDAGGIDFQLLGIGRNGHIGFNEPGSDIGSRTRLVRLDRETREDAAGGFGGIEYVPYQAITMGIATILEAREIILVARGEQKRAITELAMRGPITHRVPASYLQTHPDVTWCLDWPIEENNFSQLL